MSGDNDELTADMQHDLKLLAPRLVVVAEAGGKFVRELGEVFRQLDTATSIEEALADGTPQLLIIELPVPDSAWNVIRDLPLHRRPIMVGSIPANPQNVNWSAVQVDLLVPRHLSARGWAGLLDICQRPRPTILAHELVAFSLVDRGVNAGFQDIQEALRNLFSASRCHLGGPSRELDDALHAVASQPQRERAILISAITELPVLTLADNKSGASLQMCIAAFLSSKADGKQGIMAAVTNDEVSYGRTESAIFASLGRRIGKELCWLATHRKALRDLEESRSNGGVDPSSGLWSASALTHILAMLFNSHTRTRDPLTVAIVDVKGLEQIRALHGHSVVDAVLQYVAETLITILRKTDAVGLAKQSSFVCILQGSTGGNAIKGLERIRQALERRPMYIGGAVLPVQFIIGIADVQRRDESSASVLARAWAAVATAEAQGLALWVDKGGAGEVAASSLVADGIVLDNTYRLIHEISSGAMGVVYRAQDLKLSRPVAVKILHHELAQDEEFVAGFRAEAAVLASLRHPNIVPVYASGQDAGQVYFVMELVEGQSIGSLISRSVKRNAHIDLDIVISVVTEIAKALETLHRAGLVHRDIKPANILIDPFRNRAVLVDVGIAWRRGSEAKVAGTPGYIAPEVVSSGVFERAADVYGLAVTVYEMLTLALPWDDTSSPLKLIGAQQSTAPTRPSKHRPELALVDEILLKGMAIKPSDRWSSAVELATALTGALTEVEAKAKLMRHEVRATIQDIKVGVPELPERAAAVSRGILFRQVPRVLGHHRALAWKGELALQDENLAATLSSTLAPLSWVATSALADLIRRSPGDDWQAFGHAIGRSVVRATFQRFFPASGATLSPTATLAAMPTIWKRYHSWGDIEATSAGQNGTLRIKNTTQSVEICTCISGMLFQLVLLSGGHDPRVHHGKCETNGAEACVFDVEWLISTSKGDSPLTHYSSTAHGMGEGPKA